MLGCFREGGPGRWRCTYLFIGVVDYLVWMKKEEGVHE